MPATSNEAILTDRFLMTHDWIGKPRVESAARRLRELNPDIEIVPIPENINEKNAMDILGQADLVVDCALYFKSASR